MNNIDKGFQYAIEKKVGAGAFGEVYKGFLKKEPTKLVALKFEVPDPNKKDRLYNEYKIYKDLNYNNLCKGVPNVYWYGNSKITETNSSGSVEEKIRNILVMDYLGPSLEKLFSYYKKTFSLKTILMIAIQCIERLEYIHNNGYVHRDIKPDNFLIGSNQINKSTIYIVDFGLSKKYVDMINYEITPFKNTRQFVGTYRFCSMRSHKRLEQNRRDDLEALGYMIIYFFKKDLPWQGVKDNGKKDERSNAIFKIKKDTPISELCHNTTPILEEYMNYCRLLRYTEVPNYNYLRNLFINEMNRNKLDLDYKFDWDKL
jgi:serine/threonine protein kinase